MAKVTITEEGMIRTGEYVNKLRKAQQDGIVDENAHIPTATEILLELVEKIKTTTNGYVTVLHLSDVKITSFLNLNKNQYWK